MDVDPGGNAHRVVPGPMRVAGFDSCIRCRVVVLEETHARTGGLCIPCLRAEAESRSGPIEIIHRGVRIPTTLDVSPAERQRRIRKTRRKEAKRRRDPAVRARRRELAKAKQRALKRLRMLHPDSYEVLLAEERMKLGLSPSPSDFTSLAKSPLSESIQTLPSSPAYHAQHHGAEDVGTPT